MCCLRKVFFMRLVNDTIEQFDIPDCNFKTNQQDIQLKFSKKAIISCYGLDNPTQLRWR